MGAMACQITNLNNDCLPNRLYRRRSKKPSELRVTGLCVGNSPVPGEFPAQRDSNAENVSIVFMTPPPPTDDFCSRDNFRKTFKTFLIFVRIDGPDL